MYSTCSINVRDRKKEREGSRKEGREKIAVTKPKAEMTMSYPQIGEMG